MAKKPSNVVRDMEKNLTRFYPADDVSELASIVASCYPGTANDYKPHLRRAVDEGTIIKVKNADGRLGFASKAAVDVGNFSLNSKKSSKSERFVRMPQPQMAMV